MNNPVGNPEPAGSLAGRCPTFVEAVHREDIRKLAKESCDGGMFVLDDQSSENVYYG